MLSFAAEFPIKHPTDPNDLIALTKDWILGSPHTALRPDDFAAFPSSGSATISRGNQRLETALIKSSDYDFGGAILTTNDGSIIWEITIVMSRGAKDSWVGVRVSRESRQPSVRLPPAKKPIIVKQILEQLGGAPDGEIIVDQSPRFLLETEVELAAKIVTGRTSCQLPMIYVSYGFDDAYAVDVNRTAYQLQGMAHVIVEPSRQFSRQLQIVAQSQNVYGGTVGVYWPERSGRRSYFIGNEYEDADELRFAITNEIRTALLNRRPLFRCTWAAVQDALIKNSLETLKQSGSRDVEEYIELFDSEIKAAGLRLQTAEDEIRRLSAELRDWETRRFLGADLLLVTGKEQNLYEGEIARIVLDALETAEPQVQEDSRRQHVLRAILAANASNRGRNGRDYRTELKDILREYRTMDRSTRKGLQSLGFSISDDGKHHKLVFRDDERYVFALPKTGGDHRGGAQFS